jgi:hypothetical protein
MSLMRSILPRVYPQRAQLMHVVFSNRAHVRTDVTLGVLHEGDLS